MATEYRSLCAMGSLLGCNSHDCCRPGRLRPPRSAALASHTSIVKCHLNSRAGIRARIPAHPVRVVGIVHRHLSLRRAPSKLCRYPPSLHAATSGAVIIGYFMSFAEVVVPFVDMGAHEAHEGIRVECAAIRTRRVDTATLLWGHWGSSGCLHTRHFPDWPEKCGNPTKVYRASPIPQFPLVF